jgi:hypothetical protein
VSIGFPGGNTLSVDHLAAVDAEVSNPPFENRSTPGRKAANSDATPEQAEQCGDHIVVLSIPSAVTSS